VTGHSTAEWISRQLTEAYRWKAAPRYIIRDRDAVYGDVFIRRLRAMSIRDRPTAPRSPWQNGHCERAIGSIRREGLDESGSPPVTDIRRQRLQHQASQRSVASFNADYHRPDTPKRKADLGLHPQLDHVHGRRVSPYFLHDRHFSAASSFQIGVSRGRRIA
jgi:hypothetical protein